MTFIPQFAYDESDLEAMRKEVEEQREYLAVQLQKLHQFEGRLDAVNK